MKRVSWRSRFWLVGAAVALLGCTASRSPTEPEVSANLLGGLLDTVDGVVQAVNATLLQCTPLPSQQVRQVVGPRGGVVKIGPHQLEIPRGALRETTTITAEIPSDPVNSIRFSPEGLRFRSSTRLTMSYANCSGLGTLLPKKIVYTTELLSILEVLESLDNAGAKTVTAPVDHFSRYAVAW